MAEVEARAPQPAPYTKGGSPWVGRVAVGSRGLGGQAVGGPAGRGLGACPCAWDPACTSDVPVGSLLHVHLNAYVAMVRPPTFRLPDCCSPLIVSLPYAPQQFESHHCLNPCSWHPGTERVILHVDMDSFFASAAAVGRPELQGRPLAVCHSNSSKGTGEVSSANYLVSGTPHAGCMCVPFRQAEHFTVFCRSLYQDDTSSSPVIFPARGVCESSSLHQQRPFMELYA